MAKTYLDKITDSLIAAFSESAVREDCADYLSRGRQFAEIPVEELQNKWVAEFKISAASKKPTVLLQDLDSEFKLRKLDQPHERVIAEKAALRKATMGIGKRSVTSSPGWLAAVIIGLIGLAGLIGAAYFVVLFERARVLPAPSAKRDRTVSPTLLVGAATLAFFIAFLAIMGWRKFLNGRDRNES